MAAPLLLGTTELRDQPMSTQTHSILTNRVLLAIDQDRLGLPPLFCLGARTIDHVVWLTSPHPDRNHSETTITGRRDPGLTSARRRRSLRFCRRVRRPALEVGARVLGQTSLEPVDRRGAGQSREHSSDVDCRPRGCGGQVPSGA